MPDRFFPPGYTPLLDEDFDDLGAPVDVIEQLRTHDTVVGRSLGEVSDAVRFVGETIPMLELSARWGRWRNTLPTLPTDAPPKPRKRLPSWSDPKIEWMPGLTWHQHWNNKIVVFPRRWDTPQLHEDKSFVAMRVVRWVSRTTGEQCTTLAGERMGDPWIATSEYVHYEHYGAGLARFVVPPP